MAASKKQAGTATAVAIAIIGAVFAVEGGHVNDRRDPGGETTYGVTEAVARKHNYTGPMKDLPKSKAQEIYREDYITKPGYEPFLEISPALSHELVDTGVNTGTGRSSRWLQTALNALNRDGKDYPDVVVDGNIGPNTVEAYKALAKRRGDKKACELVIKLIDVQQGQHYLSLKKLETFMVGWADTRLQNVPLSQCG